MLTREEIRQRLTADRVRPTQTLQLLLTVVSSVFALVVIALYLVGTSTDRVSPTQADLGAVSLLSKVLGVLVVLMLATLALLPVWLMNPRTTRHRLRRQDGLDPLDKLLNLYHTLILVRMLFVGAVASFGAVVVFVAVANKTIYVHGSVWLALAPWAFGLAYGLATFPTRRRTIDFMVVRAFMPLRDIEAGAGFAARYPQAGDAVHHEEFSLGLATLLLWLLGALVAMAALTVLFTAGNWRAFGVLLLVAVGFLAGGWFVQRGVPVSVTIHHRGVVFNCRNWSDFVPFGELHAMQGSGLGMRVSIRNNRKVILPGSKGKQFVTLIRKQQGLGG